MDQEWLHRLALVKLPHIGPVTGRRLLRFGTPEELFSMNGRQLKAMKGVGEVLARQILVNRDRAVKEAETELEKLMTTPQIQLLWYASNDFPYRLKNCYDTPLLIYYKGKADLNAEKVVSIIGTRRATKHGLAFCEELVEIMNVKGVLIVSGLAHGIDACAHSAALRKGIETIGVLGHGLDSIYPAAHRNLAGKMIEKGGLLTEFPPGTFADPANFPMRNRIVAGMCDALVIVESDSKGGSMITAEIGDSYGRELFAVPGRPGDKYSRGCNMLIKAQKAKLLASPQDFIRTMNWGTEPPDETVQMRLFDGLSEEGALIVEHLKKGSQSIDELRINTNIGQGQLAAQLLDLELRGIVTSLPGKRYLLN